MLKPKFCCRESGESLRVWWTAALMTTGTAGRPEEESAFLADSNLPRPWWPADQSSKLAPDLLKAFAANVKSPPDPLHHICTGPTKQMFSKKSIQPRKRRQTRVMQRHNGMPKLVCLNSQNRSARFWKVTGTDKSGFLQSSGQAVSVQAGAMAGA